ncbi:MAG TPA: GNAT family N-acetyltransferase [Longilinea sp.]|nr:GNAT family N-acetyltransferase [Longilinea sp.]
MVEVRPMLGSDHAAVMGLVAGLSDWFDADARTRAIPLDLKYQRGIVAEKDGQVAGFVTLFVAEGRLNIGWLGVDKRNHREGIGGRLLAAAENVARELGLDEIATYTLGDGVDYPPYELTRAFYVKHGFKVYQRSQTDNPGCPEEIRISKKVILD